MLKYCELGRPTVARPGAFGFQPRAGFSLMAVWNLLPLGIVCHTEGSVRDRTVASSLLSMGTKFRFFAAV